MRVVIAGGTGLIGRRLAEQLVADGDEVVVLSRRPRALQGARVVGWDPAEPASVPPLLRGVDAVVNLAGESIGSGRWTRRRRAAIRESRLAATRSLVAAMGDGGPRVLVSGSASGYYGAGEEAVDETAPPGRDFLASVCVEWEAEARRAEARGVRCAVTRMGVVLAPEAEALRRMLLPVRLGVGGPLGSGAQWLPWVHLDDAAGILALAVQDPSVSGPLNVASPEPVRQRDFVRTAARLLHRPALLPMPAPALRLLLGEQASVVLEGRPLRPRAAQAAGYHFRHPGLEEALRDILGRPHR